MLSSIIKKNVSSKPIYVLGGGIAGCITALRLAELNFCVKIIEQKDELLKGTSNNTPGRMGLGFHYFGHIDTAIKYLKSTVNFIQAHPNFILGQESSNLEHLKRGRYMVMKNSLVDKNSILNSVNKLQLQYNNLYHSIKSKIDLSDPSEFYKILPSSKYEKDINAAEVDFCIETQECLLDWNKFKTYLVAKINNNKNITVMTNTTVERVNKKTFNGSFILNVKNQNTILDLEADFVINSTWENIERINETLGLSSKNDNISYRLKLLAEVKLPESLINKNSMFFCIGPYGMFTNLGNGIGRITYAPITNHYISSNANFESKYQKWLAQGMDPQEEYDYGEQIINGMAKFIPEMKNAELVKLMPGIVKSIGEVNIYDINSPFHRRDYLGVKERIPGWIDNPCMKLFYCEENANEVIKLLSKYFVDEEQKTYLQAS